jgi:hypothetical protein
MGFDFCSETVVMGPFGSSDLFTGITQSFSAFPKFR